MAALRSSGATPVLDLGCGEGRLLRKLLKDQAFAEMVGMDVSHRALEIASQKLRLEDLPGIQKDRIRLIHGSLSEAPEGQASESRQGAGCRLYSQVEIPPRR